MPQAALLHQPSELCKAVSPETLHNLSLYEGTELGMESASVWNSPSWCWTSVSEVSVSALVPKSKWSLLQCWRHWC